MRKIILFLTSIVLVLGCESTTENEVMSEIQNILKIDISVSADTLNINEIPKLSAIISNISNNEVYLYNDFNYGYYPKISLKIFMENSDSALGCTIKFSTPRMYEFNENHFVSLYPNQSYELFKNSDDLASKYSCIYQNPGNYRMLLKLDYSKDTLSYWTTTNDYDSTMLKMFNLIPKEIFTSNEITFTIK